MSCLFITAKRVNGSRYARIGLSESIRACGLGALAYQRRGEKLGTQA